MSTATGSAQSMRQQLDELDALLQRMLSLPINQLDDGPPPDSAPARRAPEPASVRFSPPPAPPAPPLARTYTPPRMRLIADSSPVPPPAETEPIGYERAFTINLNPQQGSSVLGPLDPTPVRAPEPAPALAPKAWRADSLGYAAPVVAPPAAGRAVVSIEPLPAAGPATTVVEPAAPASAALRPAPAPRPRTPLTLLPLALLDTVFDAAVSVLGMPGEWLSSPVGKNLLGYCGLLMLGGCAAWGLLDWFGWTW